MGFVNEYAISIIVVSLLAIFLENLLPEGSNKKYVNVLIGLLVMLVILHPLTKLPHYNNTFQIPELRIDDSDLSAPTEPYVAESFEKRLALAISDDIYKTFRKTVEIRVACTVNDAGQITGIQKIQLTPHIAEISTYIAETYGFEEAVITP